MRDFLAKKPTKHPNARRAATSRKRKPPKRPLRKKPDRPWFKIALFLGLAGALLAGSLWTYYYSRFTRLIDAHLKLRPPGMTAYYARPLRIGIGQRLSRNALVQHLESAGYQTGTEGSVGDWYRIAPDAATIEQWRRGRRERIEMRFGSGSRIEELRLRGRAARQATIKGRLVSSHSENSRGKRRSVRFDDLPDHLVKDVEASIESCRRTLSEWRDRLLREVGSGFPEKVTAFRKGMAVHGRHRQPCPECGAEPPDPSGGVSA